MKKVVFILCGFFFIASAIPIHKIDHDISGYCYYKQSNKKLVSCCVNPNDILYISKGDTVKLYSHMQISAIGDVVSINKEIQKREGINYYEIECKIMEIAKEEGDSANNYTYVINIDRISALRLFYIKTHNWLNPYSEEENIII